MQYLDSSAIVKLVVREPESDALVAGVLGDPEVVSSALAWTEVMRAARRAGIAAAQAEAVLGGIALVPVDHSILRAAANLLPATLRTLDAVHLATAATLLPDISSFVTYDERQSRGAVHLGLTAVAPGR